MVFLEKEKKKKSSFKLFGNALFKSECLSKQSLDDAYELGVRSAYTLISPDFTTYIVYVFFDVVVIIIELLL